MQIHDAFKRLFLTTGCLTDCAMELDASTLTFAIVVAVSVLWKKRRENEASKSSPEVCRLWRLMSTNKLTHPYLRAEYFQRKCYNGYRGQLKKRTVLQTLQTWRVR